MVLSCLYSMDLCTVSTEAHPDTMMDVTGQCGSFPCSDALTLLKCWRKSKNAKRSTLTLSSGSSDLTTTVRFSASVSSPANHQASPVLNLLWHSHNNLCSFHFELSVSFPFGFLFLRHSISDCQMCDCEHVTSILLLRLGYFPMAIRFSTLIGIGKQSK